MLYYKNYLAKGLYTCFFPKTIATKLEALYKTTSYAVALQFPFTMRQKMFQHYSCVQSSMSSMKTWFTKGGVKELDLNLTEHLQD